VLVIDFPGLQQKASVAALVQVLHNSEPLLTQQRSKLDDEDDNEHDSGGEAISLLNFLVLLVIASLPLPGIQRIAETISQKVQGEKR
jgi:hypothetical protein